MWFQKKLSCRNLDIEEKLDEVYILINLFENKQPLLRLAVKNQEMASYQQRIPLKGTEESIEFFTNVLRDTKNFVGCNSAEALLRALIFWQKNYGANNYINKHPCTAPQRNCGRISRHVMFWSRTGK